MKIQFELVIGQNKFLITEEAETQAEFVEKMAFFTKIPKSGPNGEDDLELVFRTTSKGHKYYSLVSQKADQEFMFGQSQKRIGELFEKGWQPLFKPDSQQSDSQQQYQQPAQAPQQYQQPVQQSMPAPMQAAPMPTPAHAAPVQAPAPTPPVQMPPVGQGVATAPQVTAQPQQAAPQVTPQQAQNNNAAANDILSQFGITN